MPRNQVARRNQRAMVRSGLIGTAAYLGHQAVRAGMDYIGSRARRAAEHQARVAADRADQFVKQRISQAFTPSRQAMRRSLRAGSHTLKHAKCVEWKFLDKNVAETNITAATGAVLKLNNDIPQNSTESGRVGSKIYIHRIDIKGRLGIRSAATYNTACASMRVALIFVKHLGGTAPTWNQVYDGTGDVFGLRNLDNTANIRVLWQRNFTVRNSYGAGFGSTATWGTKDFKIHIPLKGTCVHFTGTDGTEAQTDQGSFYLLINTDDPTDSDKYYLVNSRIRYTD